MALMDLDQDARVEATDFTKFIAVTEDMLQRKAQRVRDSAAKLRSWLLQHSLGPSVAPTNT